MINGFPTAKLESITETLIDYRGKTPPKTDSGVRLITAKVVKGGRITDDRAEYISSETYDTWMRRGFPQQWDILITTEAPLGEVAQLRAPERVALAQRLILLRGDPSMIDQQFYVNALKSPFVQDQLRARATGTTVLGIKQSELRQIDIPLPCLPIQRKIACVLSAYDNLIENNLRRIQILEEMAEALYREWFVKFRFPGHERTALVDSEMGRVPSGWDVTTVDDTFEINGGGTPSKKQPEYWDGGSVTWYSPSDLTRAGSMFMDKSQSQITELGLKKSSARLFPPFSVMLTSRATIGVVAINTTPACTNQGFINCIPNDAFPVYVLYFWMRECTDTIVSMASGATFKEISKSVFRTIPLLKPPLPLVTQFQQAVEPLGLQILNLQRRNAKSRETRDLLLPRLISGHVDVSNLDIGVGGAA